MRSTLWILATILFAGVAVAAGRSSPFRDATPSNYVRGTGEVAGNLYLGDDESVDFGGSAAAPDCWIEWETSTTPDQLRVWCTDVDGAGADGTVWYVSEGTDDLVCSGALTIAGALGGVSSLDSTTETTVEAAIDTLANLTSVQAQTVTLAGALTVEAGGCTCNQDVTSDASPAFAGATLTGPILLPDGSAAAPAMAFASDTDTGVFLGAAGRIYMSAAGTTRYQVWSTKTVHNVPADLNGQRVYDATGPLQLGTVGTTSRALVTGAVLSGGAHEIDGMLWADGGITTSVITSAGSDLKLIDDGTKGVATWIKTNTASVTFAADPGDASKTAAALIPDGAFVVGFSSRVTTAGTNCATIDIGIAGGDTDLFADDSAVVAGTLTTNASVTADLAAAGHPALAATDVIVTGNANCFGLVVALTVHYLDVSAATSN